MYEEKENELAYPNIKKEETTYDNQPWNHLKVNSNNNIELNNNNNTSSNNSTHNISNRNSILSSTHNDVNNQGIENSSIKLENNSATKLGDLYYSSNNNKELKENTTNTKSSILNNMETNARKNCNNLSADSSDDEILIHQFHRERKKQGEVKKEKEIEEKEKEKEKEKNEDDSEDDECILNLIRPLDKNKKLSKDVEKEHHSDSCSYDSDEPILMQSKPKLKKNEKKSTRKMNSTNSVELDMTKKSKNVGRSTKRTSASSTKRSTSASPRKKASNNSRASKNSKGVKKIAQKKIQKPKKSTKNNKNGKNTKTKNAKSKNTTGKDKAKDSILMGSFDPYNRTSKEKLVAQLLVRWWYVLPDWPPQDYCYDDKLKEMKLKVVSLEEYESKKDIDEHGFKKVYQISAFPGLFRDVLGNAYDLRDKDCCPSYNNFIKKSDNELLELICAAIKKQLECLKNSVYDESENIKKLERELKEAEMKLNKLTKKNKGKSTT